MAMPKYRMGLVSILCGFLLARVAVHYAYPPRGATPQQIWYSMSPTLKSVVLVGWALFVYGLAMLGNALVQRLSGKPRAGDQPAHGYPDTSAGGPPFALLRRWEAHGLHSLSQTGCCGA